MTLTTKSNTTHRLTVACFTNMHHGLLDVMRRRGLIITLPFLSTTGNNGLYGDGSTTVEFSINMAIISSQYETATLHRPQVRSVTKCMAKRYIAVIARPVGCTVLAPPLTTHGTAWKYFQNHKSESKCVCVCVCVCLFVCLLNGMLIWLKHESTIRYKCLEFHDTTRVTNK